MPDPKINKGELASHYGFALAFLNSDPDLKKLFQQAVKHTWTADRFVAELRGTKWFKHHADTVRNAIAQETADPATWKQNVQQMVSQVRDQWGQVFGGAPLPKDSLRSWATTAIRMGWSQSQLVDHMTSSLNWQKELKSTQLGGTASDTQAQIEQLLSAYGVGFSGHWKNKQIRDVLRGDQTTAGIQAQVKEIAKHQYGAFADRIDAGETIDQIADPYRQKMADLLELNPNAIHLKGKLLQNALTARNKNGEPSPMSMTQFEQTVRQDPRWKHTDNARKTVADTVSSLLNSWGLM